MYGETLKQQRLQRNYSQKDIAQAINVTQQAISCYENNINEPTISVCIRLADFYGISVDELIGHEIKKNW